MFKLPVFDKMSLFNEKLKEITLKELLSIIIILFLIQFLCKSLNIVWIDSVWIYSIIILFFIFKLRKYIFSLKGDVAEVFSKDALKNILFVVALNIFISYGLLYLSNFILIKFPSLDFLASSYIPLVCNSFVAGGFIASIIISPISEELIFRGVFLNRLNLIVPIKFSIIITALLFASLHSFGGMTAAFIFAVCMAILYLKTDNILIPIFAHFLNNLIAETIVACDVNRILFANDFVVALISVLAVISAIFIIVFIINEWNNIK